MKRFIPMTMMSALAGCAGFMTQIQPQDGAPVAEPPAEAAVEVVPVAVRKPPASARTAEQFDVTTTAERAAAAAPVEPAGERSLGTTVASLGDVARAGFWLETPLVDAPAKGRVFLAATGKSAQVDLIPIDGPATGGSRISLAAMRLIEAPLTDLPEIEVFVGG